MTVVWGLHLVYWGSSCCNFRRDMIWSNSCWLETWTKKLERNAQNFMI
jgi:hypothetical protein